MRNQADQVIAHFLNDDRAEGAGERLVIEALAPVTASFVDVGANVGRWSEDLLARAPQAKGLLIDPSLAAVALLENRFAASSGVHVLAAAVADKEGSATFFEGPGAHEESSLVSDAAPPGATPRIVSVVRLDDELGRRGWDSVDVVKIDAEGYDGRVIAGLGRYLSEGRIGAIQFEYNAQWIPAGDTLRAALDVLSEAGYAVWLVRSEGLYRFRTDHWGEFYRHTNFLAVHPRLTPRIAPLDRGQV